MSYSLFFEKQVIKFLKKVDKNIRKRIFSKLESLKQDPYMNDCKRIVNLKDKAYRVRVGDYRILYRVENNEIIVIF
ncbi:type II toxin-antitoxin system RelE/ParE family toxin [archaeon]|jgi:mRNA interferase RelE/StbE|nr:type II toxin-antitoxin system RelE/ParE family toxin [archaeon]MBT4350894.1 type II toxin-antitoxin system RelE/ParE family toxin [archaeon]MBT4646914.1 type II toxin-antitoxin system RelE/ParE family toxin [archaeon]MBT6821582.1 type II toxin-antitoxin system RelE/ParE family toxin [archaeon]MBT7392088.1 type II toxin-antitoxin system RelE/ParE family toxin [archaeon]